MRAWALLLLLAVSPAFAQQPAAVGVPPQPLAYFRCFCVTSVGGPLPQLSFSAPVVRDWNGSVYAATTQEASFKARNACIADRRGNQFECSSCRCDR